MSSDTVETGPAIEFDSERAMATIRHQRAVERENWATINSLRAALKSARAETREATMELARARHTIADLASAAARPDEPSTGRRTGDPVRTRAFTLAVDAAWAEWENTRHGGPGDGGSMHAAVVAALPFVTQALAETGGQG